MKLQIPSEKLATKQNILMVLYLLNKFHLKLKYLLVHFFLTPNSAFCFYTLLSAPAAAAATAAAKSLQSCPPLCDPINGSPPGFPAPGILQARTLEWVSHFLLQCMKVKSEREAAQSCPTLQDPMDCSPPGSSIHGIFQARVLEWGDYANHIFMFPSGHILCSEYRAC